MTRSAAARENARPSHPNMGVRREAALMPDQPDGVGGEAHEVQAGFPAFEHNQWTVEGEIERFGAFGRAGASARGWRRYVAVTVAIAMVLPIVLAVGVSLWQAIR